ncbi:MAG TPA: bifunctional hydroxymethylpyrimidine kinase/phosphomethylpyrimidine kinase [Candidatus Polarisedimenticolaceae bacterium]
MSALPAVVSATSIDPAGIDGVAADAIVLDEIGCRALAVPTAVFGVAEGRDGIFEGVPAGWLARIWPLVAAEHPAAVRIGILRDADQAREIAGLLQLHGAPHVVLAPVVRAAGRRLLDEGAIAAWRERLFPLAHVLVLRAGELAVFAGAHDDDPSGFVEGAKRVAAQGIRAVLVTGVVRQGRILDLLVENGEVAAFDATRLHVPRVDGLAGAHAAALAGALARGEPLPRAALAAQRYVGMRLQRRR